MLYSHPTPVFKPLIPFLPTSYLLPLLLTTVPCFWLFFYDSCLLPPPDSLRILQWNAGGLRARTTELLHFLSSQPVDIISMQESNLNSSSSFWIPGFSALRSDRTHSRSGILSRDPTHASGGVIIFVRQDLSFSELSTSFLSLLDSYSDYVGATSLQTNPPRFHFLLCTLPLFAPPRRMVEPTPFLPPLFPPPESLHSGGLQLPSLHWDSRGTSDPPGEKVFDWVISSDLLPLNDPDMPTLLHRSFGSCSSPGISLASFSFAPSFF